MILKFRKLNPTTPAFSGESVLQLMNLISFYEKRNVKNQYLLFTWTEKPFIILRFTSFIHHKSPIPNRTLIFAAAVYSIYMCTTCLITSHYFLIKNADDLNVAATVYFDFFRCDAVVTDKEAKQNSVTRLHKVMVYRIPTLSYFFIIKFKTSGCNSVNSDEALSYFRSKVCTTNSCPLRDVLSKCPGTS